MRLPVFIHPLFKQENLMIYLHIQNPLIVSHKKTIHVKMQA